MNLNFAAGSDLVEFADLGGHDVIQEPVDRLVVVEHQEDVVLKNAFPVKILF